MIRASSWRGARARACVGRNEKQSLEFIGSHIQTQIQTHTNIENIDKFAHTKTLIGKLNIL